MKHFETVIVSDLHLGARNSRAAEFLGFLERVAFDRLIVNGDLFQCSRLGRRLRSDEAQVLSALRSVAASHELVWIRGNHDPEPDFAWSVLGLVPIDELVVSAGSDRYLVTHGDRWDKSMELPRLVIEGAEAIYRGVQFIDRTHLLARMLKRRSKRFCDVIARVRQRALDEIHNRQMSGVILGHTHFVEDVRCGDLHYLNSGCWTERPATFVGLEAGVAQTYLFDGQTIAAIAPTETEAAAPSLALA